MPKQAQHHIGSDHVSLVKGGEPLTIEDQAIQGVSTRLLRGEKWLEAEPPRRVVDIEYREESGSIRSAMIEEVVSKHGEDRLAEYARRVSHFAAANSLDELVASASVQRNGFMINDQGVLITGSGKTLCCGLFDLDAIDFAGDRTLLWTDDSPQPAAILRMDDPNSLTVSKMLSRLICEPSDDGQPTELRHAIGHFKCDPRGGGSIKFMQLVPMIAGLVIGLFTAVVTKNMIGGPQLPWMAMLPGAIPFLIGAMVVGNRVLRRIPRLIVFRRGICIQRDKVVSELAWDDIASLQLVDRQINVGNNNAPHYVQLYTLHVRTRDNQFFGRQIKLSWTASEETATCTEFLQHKVLSLHAGQDGGEPIETATPADAELTVV